MNIKEYDILLQKYLKGKSTREEELKLLNYLLLSMNVILQVTKKFKYHGGWKNEN